MKNYRVCTFMFAAFSLALIVSVLIGTAGKAAADDCVALGGSIVGAECQINSAQVKSGTFM